MYAVVSRAVDNVRRRPALAATAFAVVAAGSTIFVANNASSNEVVVKTRSATDATSTTAAADPSTSAVPTSLGGPTSNIASPPPTSAPAPPTTVAVSTDPQADDFAGSLSAEATTTRVGEPIGIDWLVRNVSDHLVEPVDIPDARPAEATRANPHFLAAICVKLTIAGQPEPRLSMETNRNLWFPRGNEQMQPGVAFTMSDSYEPTVDDIGTVTCEVVVLDLSGGYTNLKVAARVDAIPPITITVSAEER